ncbi:MAG: thiamine-monophosphate kinase [Thermomicrobiales bacterium]|jgi:thiamine-monophosphate kinase|nr:thiamine-monophosphate kinase [Thermomicrobiales bacterium]
MKDETVRDVGEFGLIAALRDALPKKVVASRKLPIGIGDDAAVWHPPRHESLLITTDSLVEGIHFRLDWTDWRSLGHKSLAVNVSDIAAMGGVPKLATITLGLRGTERVADLQALYRGMGALAAKHNLLIAGGDIVASPHCLAIHVTLIGTTRTRGRHLTRAGARPGDLIGVSGTLGASAAGYRLLKEGPRSPRRQAITADLLIDAHLRPTPRVRLGQILLHEGAHAAMDLSDGLLGDLPKILAASGVAARLDAQAVPVAAAVRALFPDDWFDLSTRGGEDYELLFTAPPDAFPKIATSAAEVASTVTAIGEILPRSSEQPVLLLRGLGGVAQEVSPGAFDHFA